MAKRRVKNVIASRLKALLSVTETFNRANIGTLSNAGTTSAKWTSVRGSWGISSNKASSSTAASSYPISTLTFSKEDVIISVDGITPGLGTAFWVTDSGNWWGTYVDGTQQCGTCSTPGNCSSYYSCCQGTMNSSNPYDYTCCTGNYNQGYTASGTNPATCPGGYVTQAGCPCGVYNQGYTAGYYVWYTCGGSGNSAPASSCGLTYAQAQQCGGCKRNSEPYYNTGNCTCTAFVTTCSGGEVPGTPYSQWVAGTCNQTGTCTAWNTSNCNSNYAANCCGAYNATTYYSCNCVTNNSIKLIKSIAGTISTVATFSLNTAVAGFKTILSGNTVTVRAYSGSGYTSQIGSDQSSTVSGYSKTKKHGILKAPVTYSAAQGSEIDEFRVV
jgi:hypothetical protein